GNAHRSNHKLWRYFRTGTKGAMAVRKAHGKKVIGEVVGHGHLSRFTQPAPEAMFAPLEPLRIWGAIFFEKETGRGGEFEKVFVEGCRQSLLMLQYDRRGATNRSHVRVAKLDQPHELADNPLHVAPWRIARRAAHTPPPPATVSAKGAQLNGRPSPATASAEGAQLNGRPFPATASAEGAQLNGRPFPATASAEGAQLNG